jgi:protein-S-isoprenylcysteine O-methyltransferase Ste14
MPVLIIVAYAVAVYLLLLAVFAVQHTVMARPWFKRRWRRIVPGPAERASFVLAASLVLALLSWLWRTAGGIVWSLPGPAAGALRARVPALIPRPSPRRH